MHQLDINTHRILLIITHLCHFNILYHFFCFFLDLFPKNICNIGWYIYTRLIVHPSNLFFHEFLQVLADAVYLYFGLEIARNPNSVSAYNALPQGRRLMLTNNRSNKTIL